MHTSTLDPKVDSYLRHASHWRNEMEALRALVLECGLREEFKWGKPCYTLEGRNVVLIIGFKPHCALLFAKGALLKDPEAILIKPSEETQAARQIRFTDLQAIARSKSALKRYIKAAIEVENAGLEVPLKNIADRPIPAELEQTFRELPVLKTAWSALTPGRQRAYLLHIAGSKQAKTRHARVQRCIPQILAHKGLNEDRRPQRVRPAR